MLVSPRSKGDKIRFVPAKSVKDIRAARKLFKEYAASLGFDLCFQDFDQELTRLPGEYAAPAGRLYLALRGKRIVGCIALRKINKKICEMKRMYVRPRFRGKGIGRLLALKVINEAIKIGYKSMRLDTVPAMKQATALYKSLGFKKIKPYRYNPIPGALFLELRLT